jgi:thiamine-phosphate pyrophosphorylase
MWAWVRTSLTPALLAEIRRRVNLPLVAIGGITLANAPAVIEAGADAVCAIAAVVTRPEVKAEIDQFQQLFGGNPSIFCRAGSW